MTGDKQRLAVALRRRRAELGLTQEAAARRCGVSASTYAAIERAERDVRDATLRDLGNGLAFDAAAEFWTGHGPRAEAVTIEGTIRRIDRTETDDGHFRTVFEVADSQGCWRITQDRTNPPGPLHAGELLVFRAERSESE